MIFQIQPEIFEFFPDLQLGLIYVTQVNNQGQATKITDLIRQAEAEVKSKFADLALADHPTIKAWRQAYKSFGAKGYPSSIEALAKRVTKDQPLNPINKLVDLYNYISLKYLLPVGGEDLDQVQGNIQLAKASGTEEFIALGESEQRAPKEGEVVYKDDQGIICRRFNWREADRTKLEPETKQAVVVIETLLPEERERQEQAMTELTQLVEKHCQAKVQSFILNKENQQTEL